MDPMVKPWDDDSVGAQAPNSYRILTTYPYVGYRRHMDTEDALLSLAALAQATRLEVFRLLAAHEPEGLAAGEIARRLAVPHNTMSSHLAVLTRAGLIDPERRSRTIIYRVSLTRFGALASYLLKDCCGGRPEVCAPLVEALTPCCFPAEIEHA
jgi:ArsR family transcriptional regulator, arsenate/arsenite/antimonite-responsive transcriptional repressor